MSFLCVFLSKEEKNRGCEQDELLLQITPCLIFDDGIWLGINKNTSAMATDVTKFHVYVAMGALDLVS